MKAVGRFLMRILTYVGISYVLDQTGVLFLLEQLLGGAAASSRELVSTLIECDEEHVENNAAYLERMLHPGLAAIVERHADAVEVKVHPGKQAWLDRELSTFVAQDPAPNGLQGPHIQM